MKLAQYIKQQIALDQRYFDIGLNKDMTVDDKSPTRIRFCVKCKGEQP